MPERAWRQMLGAKRVLLAVAAPKEAEAVRAAFSVSGGGVGLWATEVLNLRFDLVVTGASKAAAAGGVARVLDTSRHGAVISVGIAGDLTGEGKPGEVVVATNCLLADEGVRTPTGFATLSDLGFGPFADGGVAARCDPVLVRALSVVADRAGPIATVSVCSGTDAIAARLRGAGMIAETMEGAAVALAAQRIGVPMAELRTISNTTGDRDNQRWDLRAALGALTQVLGRVGELAN